MNNALSPVLDKLLSSYEKSAVFKKGQSLRRVQIKANADSVERVIESIGYDEFLKELNRLRDDGIITYELERGYDNVEKIFLLTDEKALDKAYKIAQRKRLDDALSNVSNYLKASVSPLNTPIDLYLISQIEYIERERKLPTHFDDDGKSRNLASLLSYLSTNEDVITERALSLKLFGDTKYFERNLKDEVKSILSHLDEGCENPLEEYGVIRYPEIFEFMGNISIEMDNAKVVDFSPLEHGAYINSFDVMRIKKIRGKVTKVVFYENKANFVEMCDKYDPDVFYVLHGGMYSKAKGRFFSLLFRDIKAEYYHSGDIDLGGFRIFVRLKKNLIPTLKPLNMDIDTLLKYEDKAKIEKNEKYLNELSKLLRDDDYKEFHSLIRIMLDKKIKLEQEAYIGS